MHPSNDTPALEIKALSCRLGRRWVLDNIQCALMPGQVAYLTGDNGSGKTTLLRCIAGLQPMQQGTIQLLGYDHRTQTARARLGYMGHEHQYYDALTGLENLSLWARYWQINTAQVDEALQRVNLDRAKDAVFRKYSAGMKRRLGIARLWLAQRAVLLLDEPFAQLDHQGVDILKTMLQQWKKQGTTIILTSHRPELVHSVADLNMKLPSSEGH